MENKKNPFVGCTIVATGKLENFTRDGIKARLLELGAKPVSTVSRKTGYLIVGEKPGSKLTKAATAGIALSIKGLTGTCMSMWILGRDGDRISVPSVRMTLMGSRIPR